MLRVIGLAILIMGMAFAASAQVMMNEFVYDTQGTDDPAIMFVEIFGPAGTSLAGWSLVGINGNGTAVYLTVPLTGTIPDDGYYVVGGASVLNVDQVVTADFQNAGSSSGPQCDGLDLMNGATLVDHLCYGECATNETCNGEGGANAPDPFPSTSNPHVAIARIPDHSDTDNNGTDWVTVSGTDLTPGTPNSGTPCKPTIASLLDIRENDIDGFPAMNGTFVVTRGIVNVDNYVFDSTSISRFFFQDDDAGVCVLWGTVPQGIMAGDCVEVSGWVSGYRGLTEIAASGAGNCVFNVDTIGHADLPSPELITTTSDLESKEGMLVRMDNVTITNGAWPTEGQYGNLTVTDGDGFIGLNIVKWTDIDGSPAPVGAFTVIGILSQYDNTSPYDDYYQIMPRSTADIVTAGAEDPTAAPLTREFSLAGAYPNPFNPATAIRFEVGSARTLTLAIYDLLGREVAHEMLTGLTPGTHSYTWSPEGAAGLYLVRVSGANSTQTAKLLFLK